MRSVVSEHANDAEIAALADGNVDMLGAGTLAHVEGCDACAARLVEAAEASVLVGRGIARLGELEAEEVSAPLLAAPAVAFPRAAFAIASALVLLASAPLLPSILRGAASMPATLRVAVAALSQGGRSLGGALHGSGASWVSAALFVAVGTWIAARASRAVKRETSDVIA